MSVYDRVEFGTERTCRVIGVQAVAHGATNVIVECSEYQQHACIYHKTDQNPIKTKARRGMKGKIRFQRQNDAGSWQIVELEDVSAPGPRASFGETG